MVTLLQQKKKIAFLGPPTTYSYKAARYIFEDRVIYIPQGSFDSVISAIVDGSVDMGIIPFFNPYEEHIRECQEQLFAADLIATDITKINIDLHLASNRLKMDEVKKIRSKDHVFKQCDIWVKKNMPGIAEELSNSTAKAAEEIKTIPNSGVICSLEAIAKNGLDQLASNIQNPKNFTLFFIIEKKDAIKEWGDFSCFCFKLDDKSEEEHILDVLSKHRFKNSNKWDFPHTTEKHLLFFLEFFGSYRDLNVISFEAEIKKNFPDCKLIGTFNKSITKVLEGI